MAATKREHHFKAISRGKNAWLVVQFYVSPTMGECHTGYFNVEAPTEQAAIEIATQAA